MLFHHVRVFPLHGAFQVRINHAHLRHLLADIVIDQLRVILGAYASQVFPLRLGDSQTLEGILDLLRHIGPLRLHLCVGAHIRGDVAHIQALQGGTPIGNAHIIVYLQGL